MQVEQIKAYAQLGGFGVLAAATFTCSVKVAATVAKYAAVFFSEHAALAGSGIAFSATLGMTVVYIGALALLAYLVKQTGQMCQQQFGQPAGRSWRLLPF